MAEIDSLNIEITAKTNEASAGIDKLCQSISKLSDSLKSVETNGFEKISKGLDTLNNSLSRLDKINTDSFRNIANSVNTLSKINSNNIISVSSSFSTLRKGIEEINNINFNVDGLNNIADSVRTFGYKTSTAGTQNLSTLKTDLVDFANGLNQIKTIDFDLTGLQQLISNIAKLGSKSSTKAAENLTPIKEQLLDFVNGLNATGNIEVSGITELTSALSKMGGKSVTNSIKNLPLLTTELDNLMNTLSKSPQVSQNLIDMTNALANLAAQGSKVGTASKSITNSFKQTSVASNNLKKNFKGLASTIGKFYANFFLLIRGFNSLKDSIVSTSDYLESFNYFDVALSKIGSDWSYQFEEQGYENAEDYAKSFSARLSESLNQLSGLKLNISEDGSTGVLVESGVKNLGLNIQEVTQYTAQLSSLTNTLGQTGEVSLATASAFTKLGSDMSSLFNKDYSSVMENLQSGLTGQSRALYKYGIDVTNATLQTYAYELGIEKSVSAMTQAEKMQLRMIAILDQSRVAWGDQANTIDSLSNSIRQLKNNLSEISMVLGQLFVPLLEKVLPLVNGVTIAIKRLMISIAEIMGVELNLGEGQDTNEFAESLEEVSSGLDDVAESANKAKKGVRAFDELNVLTTSSSSDSGSTSSSVGELDLSRQILAATAEYEAAWQEAYDRMENRAEEFAAKIEQALEPVKKIFEDFAIGDFFQAGQDVSNLVVSITDFVSNAIDNVDWYGIGTKIGDFLAGIEWTSILSSVGHLIWESIKAAIELAIGIYDAAPIETAIISGIALLKFTGVGSLIVNKIKEKILEKLVEITSIFTKGGFLTNIGLVIENLFSGLTLSESVKAVFGEIGAKIAGIGTIIAGVTLSVSNFFSMWENGFNWLNEALMLVGIGITALGAIILGVPATIAGVVAAIVATVATIAIVVHDNWDSICEFTSQLWEKVSEFFANLWEDIVDIFTPVADWFSETVIEPVVTFFESLKTKVSTFFTELWSSIKDIWSSVSNWFSEHIIEPIVSFFQGLHTRVKQIFEGLWIIIQAVWIVVSNWFSEHIIEPLVNLFQKMQEKVSGFFKELWNGIKTIWASVSSWFKTNVITPVINFFSPIVEKIGGFFTDLWDSIKEVWETVSNWFSDKIITPVSDAFETACEKIGGFFTDLWSGIKKGVAGAMNAVISGVESAINFLVGGVNSIIKGFNKVVDWAADVVGVSWGGVDLIPTVSLNRIDISGYEAGGFPEQYSLIMAGEHGNAELIGSVGGRTAVAGGAEITGISDTIRETSNEEVALLRQQNALLQALLEKETGITTNQIGKAARSYAKEYYNATGRSAYSF